MNKNSFDISEIQPRSTWETFSIQLNDLNDEQAKEVEDFLMDAQKTFETKFGVKGGDFIGKDSGTI